GHSLLSFPPGAVMRPDHLALRSPAPRPVAFPAQPGRVVSEREGGPTGAPQKARLAVAGPSWLVLDQTYNPGWRAICTDASGHEAGLGKPTAIDGYANSWRVDRSCREARFAFAVQRAAVVGYGISALACLVLLVVLAVPLLRRRRAVLPVEVDAIPEPGPDRPLRAGWRVTLAATATVAVITGPVFALRMGVVLGLLTLVLLRVGVTVRRLVAIAAAAIGLVTAIYLVFPAPDKGG